MVVCDVCHEPVRRKRGIQRKRHPRCSNWVYRRSPKGRIRYQDQLTKRRAQHAATNRRPHERKSDEDYVLARRQHHAGPRPRIKLRLCPCGEPFWGGNRAIRCWDCEVTHRRAKHRAFAAKYKARSGSSRGGR